MTEADWLEMCRENWDDLITLVGNYHPASLGQTYWPTEQITAVAAEEASQIIRQEIKDAAEADPVDAANLAFLTKDVSKLAQVLHQTWFGVPESVNSWRIPGFDILCELLSDMPACTKCGTPLTLGILGYYPCPCEED